MGRTWVRVGAGLLAAALGLALTGSRTRQQDKVLKVCSDPYNLPFSNEQREGFENKIAQLVARDLGDSLAHYWWPHRRGFVRNSIRAGYCDLLIGVPKGFDLVLTTNPYYRSTYYVVTRQDRHLDVRSLDDTVLRHLKIGVNMIGYDYTNTPPAQALSAHGIVGNLVGFGSFFTDKGDQPGDIVDAVAKGDVDLAIVWGPMAGYFAKRQPVPLTLVALPDSDPVSGMPFAFDIAMGVRRGEKAFAARIDSVITHRHAEIVGILRDYNVPVLGTQP